MTIPTMLVASDDSKTKRSPSVTPPRQHALRPHPASDEHQDVLNFNPEVELSRIDQTWVVPLANPTFLRFYILPRSLALWERVHVRYFILHGFSDSRDEVQPRFSNWHLPKTAKTCDAVVPPPAQVPPTRSYAWVAAKFKKAQDLFNKSPAILADSFMKNSEISHTSINYIHRSLFKEPSNSDCPFSPFA